VTLDWRAASDQELWSLAADQHAGPAFGELFERHADRIYAHCFHRTGSWSMAEDLTSVVFLEAWRRRREVRFSGDSVLPWLLAVANNATLNAQRTLRRHRRLLVKLPPAGNEPDIAEDAVRRVDTERAAAHLLCALDGLREPEREVLALCDWAGLSYAEASDALGVPAGTIRSRLSRARQHLRDLVEGATGGTGGTNGISGTSKTNATSGTSKTNATSGTSGTGGISETSRTSRTSETSGTSTGTSAPAAESVLPGTAAVLSEAGEQQ
jgi:RNA polymerase sigma factor (sigma-70 family)